MQLEIYIDILFGLNYLVDLVIVSLTAVLSRCRLGILRLTLAALFLALYGTLAFFPGLEPLFLLPVRLAVTGAAAGIISRGGWRRFFRCWAVFWLVSLGLGGGAAALAMWTGLGRSLGAVAVNGSLYLNLHPGVLALGIALSYGLILGFRYICRRNFSREKILVPLEIWVGDDRVRLTALIDTGCELTAPGTGRGVVLASRHALGNLANIAPERQFSLPVRTAKGTGCLWAFYPERVVCPDRNFELACLPAVGVARESFSPEGLYDAIINPDILWERKKNGGKGNEIKLETVCCGPAEPPADETGPVPGKRRILHRRERYAAAATEPGGGSGTPASPGPAGDQAGGPADPD